MEKMIKSLSALPIKFMLRNFDKDDIYGLFLIDLAELCVRNWVKSKPEIQSYSEFRNDKFIQYILTKEMSCLLMSLVFNYKVESYTKKGNQSFLNSIKTDKFFTKLKEIGFSDHLIESFQKEVLGIDLIQKTPSGRYLIEGWYKVSYPRQRKIGSYKAITMWHILRMEKILHIAGYNCSIDSLVTLLDKIKKNSLRYNDELLIEISDQVQLRSIKSIEKTFSHFDIYLWRYVLHNDLVNLKNNLIKYSLGYEKISFEELKKLDLLGDEVRNFSVTLPKDKSSALELPKGKNRIGNFKASDIKSISKVSAGASKQIRSKDTLSNEFPQSYLNFINRDSKYKKRTSKYNG